MLAQRLRSHGCSLAVRNARGPAYSHIGFRQYTYKTFWHKHFERLDGISFYPEMRYHTYRVHPRHWHPKCEGPILFCYIDVGELGDGSEEQFKERSQALLDDDWKWEMRDGLVKYVHVDDLEKIEGPAPEGPF